MNVCGCSHNTTGVLDLLGMPQLPEIPQIILCLYFPGTDGWYNHWSTFNKKVKDFHQSMIDFNWRLLDWYSLKAIQMERFGVKRPYIAGTLVMAHKLTIIYTRTICDCEVDGGLWLKYIRNCPTQANH